MDDWPVIIVRFGLFADLGLLFGIPLFGLYAMGGRADRHDLVPFRSLIPGFAIGGIGLSLLGFALQAAAMAGTRPEEVDSATLAMLVTETSLGWALIARLAALLVAAGCAFAFAGRPAAALTIATVAGAIAVATLAWSGHGGATEGALGIVHLLSDILHLLAAAAWLGALLVFLILVVRHRTREDAGMARLAHRALAGFSVAGTIMVVLIMATGLANGAFIVGLAQIRDLPATLYGQLLLVKLALFAAMLVLAAINRFHLTPTFEAAIEAGDMREAIWRLQRSLAVETGFALLILALVAWLGTLAPPAAAA